MSLALAVLSIEDEPVFGVRAAIDALGPDDCRWPLGEVRAPDFHFCCSPRELGSAYCSTHRRLNKRPVFTAE